MTAIRHKLVIKTNANIVFKALTTQEGLASWWAKETTAKPEAGFVNIFHFGNNRNEIEVAELIPNRKVVWKVLHANEEWVGTTLTFELEQKDDKTALRFSHADWKAETDFQAECNFAWGRFMMSLKSYCETGTGTPS